MSELTPFYDDPIAEALRDLRRPNIRLRWRAVETLAQACAEDALIDTLCENEHWFIRMAAAQALGRLKSSRAVPILANLLFETRDEWMQFDIVIALLQIGGDAATQTVKYWKETTHNSIVE
jgi:hypothetical protein